MSSFVYDGFISYRHNERQRAIAQGLQYLLHGFAKPWYQLRAVRLYRDETNLSARPDLWDAIENALNSSRYLILLASPEAAKSRWVEKEVAHWLKTRVQDTIIIVVTEGIVAWDADNERFDAKTTALPPTLVKEIKHEPRWLDLTWVTDPTADLRLENLRCRDAVASLAAPLRGVDKDTITGEDVRQRQKTLRLAYGAAATITVLFLIALMAAVGFLFQRSEAERQRDAALARLLASEGFRRGAENAKESIPYFLASLNVAETPNAISGLFQFVQNDPHLAMRLATLPERHSVAAYSASGQTVGVGMESGGVMLWRINRDAAAEAEAVLENGKPRSIRFLPGLGRPIAALRVVDWPAEAVLAVDLDGRILEWSPRAIADVASPIVLNHFSGEIGSSVDVASRPYVSISAKADVIVASTYSGMFTWTRQGGVRKVVTAVDGELALGGPIAVTPDGRSLAFTLAGDAGLKTPAVIAPLDEPRMLRQLPQLAYRFGITVELNFDSTGNYLAIGSLYALAAVFRIERDPALLRVVDHAGSERLNAGNSVTATSLSSNAKYLASIHRKNWYLWDVASGTQLGLRQAASGTVLDFHPEEQLLLTGQTEKTVHLVDFTLAHLKRLGCMNNDAGISPAQWRELAGDTPLVQACR